jgi:hypothetical protein
LGPGRQILPPHRDGERHVGVDGAILPTTVSPYAETRQAPKLYGERTIDVRTVTQSTIHLRRGQSHHDSVASMRSADTRPARSAASLASSVKPSAQPKPSQSRPRSAWTAAVAQPATTLT